MKRLVLAALLVSWVASPALAVKLTIRASPNPQPGIAANGNAWLVSAIRGHDPKAIAALLARPLAHGALWFPDAACTKRFGAPAMLTTDADIHAFARCLATLQLEATTRQSTDPLDVVLTYKPGVEVEVRFTTAAKVSSFGADWALAPATPMLTAQAFEALRKTGTTNLDAAIGTLLEHEVASSGSAASWLRICLDPKGNVVSAHALAPAAIAPVFEAAVADWAFQPFIHRGIALAVCSNSLLSYPAASAPTFEVLPPPPAPPGVVAQPAPELDLDEDDLAGPPSVPPQNIPPTLLETMRVSGTKLITPDAVTRQQIAKAARRVIGSFKLCISTTGAVSSLGMLKSTGFAAYDAKITREMHTWKYRPYLVSGVATPVCTAVTFIYGP
jgi:hypothetical protein